MSWFWRFIMGWYQYSPCFIWWNQRRYFKFQPPDGAWGRSVWQSVQSDAQQYPFCLQAFKNRKWFCYIAYHERKQPTRPRLRPSLTSLVCKHLWQALSTLYKDFVGLSYPYSMMSSSHFFEIILILCKTSALRAQRRHAVRHIVSLAYNNACADFR